MNRNDALALYLQQNYQKHFQPQASKQTKSKSVTAQDLQPQGKMAIAPGLLKRRPLNVVNRVKHVQDVQHAQDTAAGTSFQGLYDSYNTQYKQQQSPQQFPLNGRPLPQDNPKPHLFLNQRSEEPLQMPREWQKLQQQSPKFHQKAMKKQQNSLLFANSKTSSYVYTQQQSREHESKSIIAALLREESGPTSPVTEHHYWQQTHKSSQPEVATKKTLNQDLQASERLKLEFDRKFEPLNLKNYRAEGGKIIAHEQHQSESHKDPTLGEPTVNDTRDLSPPGSAISKTAPGSALSKTAAIKEVIDMKKEISQATKVHEELQIQEQHEGTNETFDEENSLSPNAIERNSLKQIEEELIEKSRSLNLDPKLVSNPEFTGTMNSSSNEIPPNNRQQNQSPLQEIIEREKNLILEQMQIQQSLELQRESEAQSALSFRALSPKPSAYAAYSKLKKEQNKPKRSVTPLMLNQFDSMQIQPRTQLTNLESTRKQYPNLLTPLNQNSIDSMSEDDDEPAANSSRNKSPDLEALRSRNVQDLQTIFSKMRNEKAAQQPLRGFPLGGWPTTRNKVHFQDQRTSSGMIFGTMDIDEINRMQDTNMTFKELRDQAKFKGGRKSPIGGKEVKIELNKLDKPIYMKRFEELVNMLNPFSVNQIQKLSPRHNKVIDKFMDTKKWLKFKQANQRQFNTALSSVIGNLDTGNMQKHQTPDTNELSNITMDLNTQTQDLLQSKLSDQADIETQRMEKNTNMDSNRHSKLSSRLIERSRDYAKQSKETTKMNKTEDNKKSAKILFKTRIKVSPMDTKRTQSKMGTKQNKFKPLKVRYKNKKTNVQTVDNSVNKLKIVDTTQNSKEFKEGEKSNLPQLKLPLQDADSLKYKLDVQEPVDDHTTDSMIRIQAMGISSRIAQIHNVISPTTQSFAYDPMYAQSPRNNTETNEELNKKTQIDYATSPHNSPQSLSRGEDINTVTTHVDVNSTFHGNNSPIPSKRIISGRKGSKQSRQDILTASKQFIFQKDLMMENQINISPNSKVMINSCVQTQTDNKSADSTVGPSQLDQYQNAEKQSDKQLYLKVPQPTLDEHHKDKNFNINPKMRITEWSQESAESNEKSHCNTITFGSNNPKSMDSQKALDKIQITGRKIKQLGEKQEYNIDGLTYDLFGSNQLNVQQIQQQLSMIRKIQIREKEIRLQESKEQLKQIQQHGINRTQLIEFIKHNNTDDDKAIGKHEQAKTQFPFQILNNPMENINLQNSRIASLHAKIGAQSSKFGDRKYQNSSVMSQNTYNNSNMEKEMDFLSKKFDQRKGQPLKTSQGIRLSPTISYTKEGMNQDLIGIHEKEKLGKRKKSVLPPISQHQRQRNNNRSLLQPLRQGNQLSQLEQNEVLEGSKIQPSANQANYQQLVSKFDEEFTRLSSLPNETVKITGKRSTTQNSPRAGFSSIKSNLSSRIVQPLKSTMVANYNYTMPKKDGTLTPAPDRKAAPPEKQAGTHSEPAEQQRGAKEHHSAKDKPGHDSPQNLSNMVNLPTPMPENIMIQVEDSNSISQGPESATHYPKGDTSSIGGYKGDYNYQTYQNSLENFSQKDMAAGMGISVTEIMTQVPSKEQNLKINAAGQGQKDKKERKKIKVAKKDLTREQSVMFVQGQSPRNGDGANVNQSAKYGDCTNIQINLASKKLKKSRNKKSPLKAQKTKVMDPSETNVFRQNQFFETIRKQSVIRKNQHSVYSSKRGSFVSEHQRKHLSKTLHLTNTINYQSSPRGSPTCAMNSSTMHNNNVFPALIEQQEVYENLVQQKQNMDKINIDRAAVPPRKTVVTQVKIKETSNDNRTPQLTSDTQSVGGDNLSPQKEIMNYPGDLDMFSIAEKPAIKVSMQRTQRARPRTNSVAPEDPFHVGLKSANTDNQNINIQDNDVTPTIVHLTEYEQESQKKPLASIEELNQINFAESSIPNSSMPTNAYQTSSHLKSTYSRTHTPMVLDPLAHRTTLPVNLNDLIKTSRIPLTPQSANNSQLNMKGSSGNYNDHLKQLPSTKNANNLKRIQQITQIRGFSPLLGGKIHEDGSCSYTYYSPRDKAPEQAAEIDAGNLNEDSADRAEPESPSMNDPHVKTLALNSQTAQSVTVHKQRGCSNSQTKKSVTNHSRVDQHSDLRSVMTPYVDSVTSPDIQPRLNTPLQPVQQNDSSNPDSVHKNTVNMKIESQISDPRKLYDEIFSEKGVVNLQEQINKRAATQESVENYKINEEFDGQQTNEENSLQNTPKQRSEE